MAEPRPRSETNEPRGNTHFVALADQWNSLIPFAETMPRCRFHHKYCRRWHAMKAFMNITMNTFSQEIIKQLPNEAHP